jgi:hypothetical protein
MMEVATWFAWGQCAALGDLSLAQKVVVCCMQGRRVAVQFENASLTAHVNIVFIFVFEAPV